MSFTPEVLLQELDELTAAAGTPARYVVAFSGGLDSTVLAHALAMSRDRHETPILAVYVDHGLQRDSSEWSGHCRAFAARHDLEFEALSVVVDTRSGMGLEAAARESRYAALRNILQ